MNAATIWARADRALTGLFTGGRPPSSVVPAEPLDGKLGTLAVRPGGVRTSPGPFPASDSRAWHRHGWFAAGAGSGEEESRKAAVSAMEAWLRQDLPGQGPAWEHGSDLTARLVHWHAGLGFLEGLAENEALRRNMAGSAAWHLRLLAHRQPLQDNDGLRLLAHLSGMVVGGYTFPEIPEARSARADGLAGLRWALPRQLHPDGSARDHAPGQLALALWFVAIARAVARANGAPFPADADAAFARGARYLEKLSGDVGGTPPFGEDPSHGVLDAPSGSDVSGKSTLPGTLWNLAVGWGLEEGTQVNDARASWLGVDVPSSVAAEAVSGKNWSIWSYRDEGVVVGFLKVKNQPSRVTAIFGEGREAPYGWKGALGVAWEVGASTLLHPEGQRLEIAGLEQAEGGTLEVARVDGKKARIEGHHDAWRGARVRHARNVLLNQARLINTDRLLSLGRRPRTHSVTLRWPLGAGLTVEKSDSGSKGGFVAKGGLVAKGTAFSLVIQLPSELSWSVEQELAAEGEPRVVLVGTGEVEGDVELVSSFEVR